MAWRSLRIPIPQRVKTNALVIHRLAVWMIQLLVKTNVTAITRHAHRAEVRAEVQAVVQVHAVEMWQSLRLILEDLNVLK